jgi:hypothetical protein
LLARLITKDKCYSIDCRTLAGIAASAKRVFVTRPRPEADARRYGCFADPQDNAFAQQAYAYLLAFLAHPYLRAQQAIFRRTGMAVPTTSQAGDVVCIGCFVALLLFKWDFVPRTLN